MNLVNASSSLASPTMPKWFVYVLRCSDQSLYTGITNDLAKRMNAHRAGKGAKYTRSRLPVRLEFFRRVRDRSAALKEEARIKKMSRGEKLKYMSITPTNI